MKPDRNSSPWFILIVVLLASMAASLNQFKVPPVMPLLLTTFHASAAQGGLLMSAFALAGLFLAIPAGFLLEKFGYRLTGLLAMSSLIFGGALGIATDSIDTLLASRFLEGAGMSLLAVAAPALVALYFSRDKRGQAMGVWGVWVPLGSLIMFLLAPPLAGYGGYRAVWWFGIFYTAVAGILFGFFIHSGPRPSPRTQSPPVATNPPLPGSATLRNGQLWLTSLLFGCFNFVYTAFITWTPTFLNQVRGLPIARADLLVSTTNMLVIVASPLAGWLSDKIGSRKAVCSVPLLLLTFLFPLNPDANAPLFLGLAMVIGFFAGFVPPAIFSAGTEIAGDEQGAGMAMAIIQIGQNCGMILGPLVFGWAVEAWGGWKTAFWILAPVSLLGAVAGWRLKIR